jgi:hypothetical protein
MTMHEMNCPFCGRGMRPGRLRGDARLCWIPAEQKQPAFALKGSVPEGQVALTGDFGYWKGHTVPAYYCGTCKKVIIDTE